MNPKSMRRTGSLVLPRDFLMKDNQNEEIQARKLSKIFYLGSIQLILSYKLINERHERKTRLPLPYTDSVLLCFLVLLPVILYNLAYSEYLFNTQLHCSRWLNAYKESYIL